jgi:hypothetical protein
MIPSSVSGLFRSKKGISQIAININFIFHNFFILGEVGSDQQIFFVSQLSCHGPMDHTETGNKHMSQGIRHVSSQTIS